MKALALPVRKASDAVSDNFQSLTSPEVCEEEEEDDGKAEEFKKENNDLTFVSLRCELELLSD